MATGASPPVGLQLKALKYQLAATALSHAVTTKALDVACPNCQPDGTVGSPGNLY
jgi:hypothetical protein